MSVGDIRIYRGAVTDYWGWEVSMDNSENGRKVGGWASSRDAAYSDAMNVLRLVGHAVMGDGQPLVMCQMCGQTYIPAGVYGSVPDHDRQDILAMIDRGDFAP